MEQSGGGPLCPMGVTMDLALRIVTGLTNVFGGWGGGRGEGLSRMFGIAVARPTSAHHLLFNPLRGAARCTYVTRPWNYNY